MSGPVSAAPAGAAGLLQLHPDLLHKIWDKLNIRLADQHALRCTCKAIRDSSDAWISSLHIQAGGILPLFPRAPAELARQPADTAVMHLSCFPRTAVLRRLVWRCHFEADPEHYDSRHRAEWKLQETTAAKDLLPIFLFQTRHRLAAVTSLSFHSTDFSCGDAAALVEHCPQLQHLAVHESDVVGPVFAPLHRLASFSSLHLHNVRTPLSHMPMLLDSLSTLTSLTKLLVHGLPDDEELAMAFVPPASPALMPWLSRLEHLRHLCLQLNNIGEEDGAAAGQLLVQHISCLQHLTHLQTYQCFLPSPCPALACAPNLTQLKIIDQVLDTPLIRMLAAMPRLTSLTVSALKPDSDLSHLTCSWQDVRMDEDMLLQQLVWLPRGIRCLPHGHTFKWALQEGDTLEGACSLLQRAAQLFAESPEWSEFAVQATLCATPIDAGPLSKGAAQPRAWELLFQALSPLQQYLQGIRVDKGCELGAEAARQGAKWLPEVRTLLIDPRTPGLDNFLESLGETAWLDNIGICQELRSVDGAPVSSIVAALHRMLVKRTAVGRRLMVFAGGLLTKDQQAALRQAAQQEGESEAVVVF